MPNKNGWEAIPALFLCWRMVFCGGRREERRMNDIMFDYRFIGKNLTVPTRIVQKFEKEARKDFPYDDMLMEIHVLRAIKSYAREKGEYAIKL